MASPFTPSTIPSGGASPLTTKGDLYTYTTTDARLGVGSDGQLLTAASGQSTGLQWVAGSAVTAMTLLSTTTLGADGTFDIQSISQSYNDLELHCIVRGTDAGAFDSLRLRFNNISTATYGTQQMEAIDNNNAQGQELNSATSGWAARYIQSAGGAANLFSFVKLVIPGYTVTTWGKQWQAFSSYLNAITTNGMVCNYTTGFTAATTAVSRIQLFGGTTANLLTGSTVRVYGIL